MGIFDGILGGQKGLTHTTTTTNHTNLAQQYQGLANHHNALQNAQVLHNPQTWATTSIGQAPYTPYGETLKNLMDALAEVQYILQRTVENYEELQAQHKALQDITKAGEDR